MREYLTILELSALDGEEQVDDALRVLLGRSGKLTAKEGEQFVKSQEAVPGVTAGTVAEVNLSWFDQLLEDREFDVVIIDDIGYVQQGRDEMEVLFTLLAERYERGSVMLTSNLPFSKWESIFKDPLTTAAAIDRLVHHSVILELTSAELPSDMRRSSAKAARRTSDRVMFNAARRLRVVTSEGETQVGLKAASFRFALTPGRQKNNREI